MDLRRYDLNLLVVLDALLDEANVTRAGLRVHLSQSATSAALDRLRYTFKDPLLVKVKGRMELTGLAKQLRAPLKRALHAVSITLEPPGDFKAATSKMNFRIGMTDYLGFIALTDLHLQLAQKAPGTSLSILPVTKDAALDMLDADELDIAVIVEPEARADIHRKPMLRERFACVMRETHKLAKGPLTLSRLCEVSQLRIQTHGRAPSLIEQALNKSGVQCHVAVTVPHFGVALALLKDTDLVAFMPRRIAESQAAQLGLKVREAPLRIPGYTMDACWHLRTHRDPSHVWFRRILSSVAAKL